MLKGLSVAGKRGAEFIGRVLVEVDHQTIDQMVNLRMGEPLDPKTVVGSISAVKNRVDAAIETRFDKAIHKGLKELGCEE